jgi:hypothetical protein
MRVLAINGSPRKKWNTATLLQNALDGAASQGAETELVHLCDLDFKGCTSCFACKLKSGKSYGKCAVQDGLTSVLGTCSIGYQLLGFCEQICQSRHAKIIRINISNILKKANF